MELAWNMEPKFGGTSKRQAAKPVEMVSFSLPALRTHRRETRSQSHPSARVQWAGRHSTHISHAEW